MNNEPGLKSKIRKSKAYFALGLVLLTLYGFMMVEGLIKEDNIKTVFGLCFIGLCITVWQIHELCDYGCIKKKWFKIFLILIVLTVIVTEMWYANRGYLIIIKDYSSEYLVKIEISVDGVKQNIPHLFDRTFRKRIKSSIGGSYLEVGWVDTAGNSYKHDYLADLSSYGTDTIYIALLPKGGIDVTIEKSPL